MTALPSVNLVAAAWGVACCLGLLFGSPAHADDAGLRLRIQALIEEGDLLLEEASGLDPTTQDIEQQGPRLSQAEKELTEGWADIEQEVARYNAAVKELTKAVRQHRESCPRELDQDSAIETCNGNAAGLTKRSAALDRKRLELQRQQQELTKGVDDYAAKRKQWMEHRREHAPKAELNARDGRNWLDSARSFLATDEFGALSRRAGEPGACRSATGSSGTTPSAVVSDVKRVYACLKAVRSALQ